MSGIPNFIIGSYSLCCMDSNLAYFLSVMCLSSSLLLLCANIYEKSNDPCSSGSTQLQKHSKCVSIPQLSHPPQDRFPELPVFSWWKGIRSYDSNRKACGVERKIKTLPII